MPGTFGALDTGMPDLSRYDTTEKKLQAVQDYLVQLLEQLRYTLHNISTENFNEKEVTGWLGQVITEPVKVAIQNAEEQIYTQIDVTADGIKSTVASAQDKYDSGNLNITQFGYGAPTVVAASGTVYLDQSTGYYYTSNGTTWTKSALPLPMKSSEFKQTADELSLKVTGPSAPEWVTSTAYAEDDVVKTTDVVTTASDQKIVITYYKCTRAHTSGTNTKPGSGASWETYWEETAAPNVQSMIDLDLTGLTLSYNNASIGNNEHNGAYITLSKDGTVIGGGKVFVKDLDASTITAGSIDASQITVNNIDASKITTGTLDASTVTVENIDASEITTGSLSADRISGGTLDAGSITLRDEFTVQALDNNDVSCDCGTLGGYVRETGGRHDPMIEIVSQDDNKYIEIGNEEIVISVRDPDTGHSIDMTISPDQIIIKRRSPSLTTYDLLSLLDQI